VRANRDAVEVVRRLSAERSVEEATEPAVGTGGSDRVAPREVG
jgi:hypothetical protein